MYKIAILADSHTSMAQAILTALYCDKRLTIEGAENKKPEFSIITSNNGDSHSASVTTLTSNQINLLDDLGIELNSLIDNCDGYIHYADNVTNTTENHETHAYCSLSNMGVAMQGVDFHHLLNLQRLTQPISDKSSASAGIDTSLAHYSLNTQCQTKQKAFLPSKDLRNIRSSLEITLNVQSNLFVHLLAPLLTHLKIASCSVIDWQFNYINAYDPSAKSEKLGYIESVGETPIFANFFIDHRDALVNCTNQPVALVQTKTMYDEGSSKHFEGSSKHFKGGQHNGKQKSKLPEQGLTLQYNQVIQIKRLRSRSLVSVSDFNAIVLPSTSDVNNADSNNINEKLWRGNLLDLSRINQFQAISTTLSISPSEYIVDMWLSYFSSAATEAPMTSKPKLIEDFANKQFQQALLNLRTFYLCPLYIHNPRFVAECLSSTNIDDELLSQLKQRTRLFLQKGTDYPSDFDLIPKAAWVNMYLSLHQWPQETDLVAYQIDDVKGILDKLRFRFEQAVTK